MWIYSKWYENKKNTYAFKRFRLVWNVKVKFRVQSTLSFYFLYRCCGLTPYHNLENFTSFFLLLDHDDDDDKQLSWASNWIYLNWLSMQGKLSRLRRETRSGRWMLLFFPLSRPNQWRGNFTFWPSNELLIKEQKCERAMLALESGPGPIRCLVKMTQFELNR